MIIFNPMGLLGAVIGFGVGMGGVLVLHKSSTFAAMLWLAQSSAFVCWLFGLLYDHTTTAPNIFKGYVDCYAGDFGAPRKYRGRFALCGVPLICAPIGLLFAFLFFWVTGILLSATTEQNVTFLVVSMIHAAVTTMVTFGVDRYRRS